jgi:hypothetical protein
MVAMSIGFGRLAERMYCRIRELLSKRARTRSVGSKLVCIFQQQAVGGIAPVRVLYSRESLETDTAQIAQLPCWWLCRLWLLGISARRRSWSVARWHTRHNRTAKSVKGPRSQSGINHSVGTIPFGSPAVH